MSFGNGVLGWGGSHFYESLLHSKFLLSNYNRNMETTIINLLYVIFPNCIVLHLITLKANCHFYLFIRCERDVSLLLMT